MEEDASKNTQSECDSCPIFPKYMENLLIKDELVIKDEPVEQWDNNSEELNETYGLKTEEPESEDEDEEEEEEEEEEEDSDLENHESVEDEIQSNVEKSVNEMNEELIENRKDFLNQIKLLTQSLGGINTFQALQSCGTSSSALGGLYLLHLQQQQQVASALNLQLSQSSKDVKHESLKSEMPPTLPVNLASQSKLYESFLIQWKTLFENILKSVIESPQGNRGHSVNPVTESLSSLDINSVLCQSLINPNFKNEGSLPGSDVAKNDPQDNYHKESSSYEDNISTVEGEYSMDDNTLVSLSVRDFNRAIHSFPINVQKKLKKRRRTLKNRAYANNCRARRQVYKKKLEMVNATLKNQIEAFKSKLGELKMTDVNLERENPLMRPTQEARSSWVPLISPTEAFEELRASQSKGSSPPEMLDTMDKSFDYPPTFASSNSMDSFSTMSPGRESASPEPLVINLNTKKKVKRGGTHLSKTSKTIDTFHNEVGTSCIENMATESYVIEDSELLELSTTELNKRIKGWPHETQNTIKKRRRTLKNRSYAKNCRQRRLIHREELEIVNAKLKKELDLYKTALLQLASRECDAANSLSSFALIENKSSDRNGGGGGSFDRNGGGEGSFSDGGMLDDTDEKLKRVKEEPFGVAEDSLDLELGSYADSKEESSDKTEASFTKRKRLLSDDIESLTENNNNNNNHNNNNRYSTNEQIFSTEGSNSSKDRLRRKRKKVLGLIKTNNHNDRIEQQEPLFKIVKKETLSNDIDSEEEISELNNGVYDSTEEEALPSAAEVKFNVEAQSDSFSSRPSYGEKLLFSSNNRDDDDNSLSNDNLQNEREDRSSNSKMKIDFFRRKIKFKNKNKNTLRDQVTL